MFKGNQTSSIQITRDRKLVKQLVRGNDKAFKSFVDEFLPKLYRYARCQLNNSEDVEDVVQTTLINAARGLANYRGEATLLTWLIQICRHEIYRKLSNIQRHDFAQSFSSDDVLKAVIESLEAPAIENPDNIYARSELIAWIRLILDQLPENYARLLELKYVEGLSSREIAKKMQTSDEATQSMLARARHAFREVCHQALPGYLSINPDSD